MISKEVNNGQHDCHFYYDESNNIRKLWLDEDDFNAPVDCDFVLGGVMHINKPQNANVNELKNQLRLPISAKELKFKYIRKSKDFLGCLSEPKVKLFLQWLYQSDAQFYDNGTEVFDKQALWTIRNQDGTTTVPYATITASTGNSVTIKGSSSSSYVNKYVVLTATLSDDATVFKEFTVQLKSLL